mgnify:CR=1 FL=1
MLADFILVVHTAFVLFVVVGALLIWLGWLFGWAWVRSPWFRRLHLAAIVFVAIETLLGLTCPLTTLEDELRGASDPQGFIARWLQRGLYYSAPDWVFSAVYVGFALLVALTYWRFPPRR